MPPESPTVNPALMSPGSVHQNPAETAQEDAQPGALESAGEEVRSKAEQQIGQRIPGKSTRLGDPAMVKAPVVHNFIMGDHCTAIEATVQGGAYA